MDYSLFKIAGAVAGIGGLALASVVYVFREVIRKEIFPQLTKQQAYGLLNRIVVLIFVTGLLGIIAYVTVNWRNQSPGRSVAKPTNERVTPSLPKAELSGTVVDQYEKPIQGAKITIDDIVGMTPVETSSDGIFTLRDIQKKYGDPVRIRVVAAGYEPNPYVEDLVLGKAPPIIKLRKRR